MINKITKLYYDTFHNGKPPLELGTEIKWGQIIGSIAGFDITRAEWKFVNDSNNIVPTELEVEYGKNLGKPISILDVLRLLETKRRLAITKHDLDTKGYLTTYELHRHSGDEAVNQIEIDLSKGDLLKNQSKEVINKIAKLLNI